MATIAENLQTIKDSTDAIKLAIIDKGGTITGDITTWAESISNIGSSNSDYTFTGTLTYNSSKVIFTGHLNQVPENTSYLMLFGTNTGGIINNEKFIDGKGPYTVEIDFNEPINNSTVPAICILEHFLSSYRIISVEFINLFNLELTN